ncbi:Hypothetical protein NCS54_01234700 [Fusarium falciforme]|uniref:Hypothetical protein n=1 Tax=Fusarium falciforme TaxID=195108 RepID=UPI0023013D2F|nr:Hypothetical protein NCS54_01234700 [Fusarium falciforme]WAO94749.1 Hypothetical protein NCS54_01234700 [Fusarium falciforme]
MPWRKPPRVNFEEQAEYRWPFWKLGLQEDDLFGDLHERFNTVPMFIQDPDAFHHDVNEIAHQALDKEDFYARLQKRRDQRVEELLDMENKIGALHLSGYNRLTDDQRFHRLRLECFASLDCLVAFCASFLTPNEKGMKPSLGQFGAAAWSGRQANLITDIFLRSEERKARSTLFKGLAASLNSSTPDSRDLGHADLPPSPPEGDGECPPSTTLGRDSTSLPPEPCAPETPIRRKRKHSVDFDADDSPQVKRPRPESIDDLEHDEADTSGVSEETNREDDVSEFSSQRNEHSADNAVGQNTAIPPIPDPRPYLSPVCPKLAVEQASPQSPSRSDNKTGQSSNQDPSSTRPSTKHYTPEPSIGENTVSPQRRSDRISARSATRELKT